MKDVCPQFLDLIMQQPNMISSSNNKKSIDTWCNNGRGMRVLIEMNKAGQIKQLHDPYNISWG